MTQLVGTVRLLDLPTRPRPNDNFEFQLRGEAGDLLFVFASLASARPLPLPGIDGPALIGVGSSAMGTTDLIDGFGFSLHSAHFLTPGPTLEFHAQAWFLDAVGGLRLSGPESILFH